MTISTRSQLEIKEEYFLWLCAIVGFHDEYEEVLRLLYEEDFYCSIPNDDNRAADGLELRIIFGDDRRSPPHIDDTVSVLEILIALAKRYAFITQDERNGSPYDLEGAFWTFVNNLQLDPRLSNRQNQFRIRRFLNREYNPNGTGGGLFPLTHTNVDQRTLEIWYQMMAYIRERLVF